jgi:hypothetical protein
MTQEKQFGLFLRMSAALADEVIDEAGVERPCRAIRIPVRTSRLVSNPRALIKPRTRSSRRRGVSMPVAYVFIRIRYVFCRATNRLELQSELASRVDFRDRREADLLHLDM